MNERLAEFYRGVAIHATADSEHTAALELLALVMAADKQLSQSEIDTIKQISDDWRDGDFTFDKYVGPAIVKAQDAITNDAVQELIADMRRTRKAGRPVVYNPESWGLAHVELPETIVRGAWPAIPVGQPTVA